MSISTKTGDDGTTGLMFNRRVSKTDQRVIAYGTVDELNATLGLARSFKENLKIEQELYRIQKELIVVMGELATHPDDYQRYQQKGFKLVTEQMVKRLTELVNQIEGQGVTFKGWDTPGATPASAALHLARTICRRAERAVLELGEDMRLSNPYLVQYLNRLSDVLWLFAQLTSGKGDSDSSLVST